MTCHPKGICECVKSLRGQTADDRSFQAKMREAATRVAKHASQDGGSKYLANGEIPESVKQRVYMDGYTKMKCLALNRAEYAAEMELTTVKIRDVKGVPEIDLATRVDLSQSELVSFVEFIPGTDYREYTLKIGNQLLRDEHYLDARDCVYPEHARDCVKHLVTAHHADKFAPDTADQLSTNRTFQPSSAQRISSTLYFNSSGCSAHQSSDLCCNGRSGCCAFVDTLQGHKFVWRCVSQSARNCWWPSSKTRPCVCRASRTFCEFGSSGRTC